MSYNAAMNVTVLATAGAAAGTVPIPVLVDSTYGSARGGLHSDFLSRDFPYVLYIAGGVGITAVLPVPDGAGGVHGEGAPNI